ncbi:hypothetical protein XaC1_427 [Xanthomonas phage XaC1]|nr:hypothetical protein XaC1_427 [Xanthomonas phage XaC1]
MKKVDIKLKEVHPNDMTGIPLPVTSINDVELPKFNDFSLDFSLYIHHLDLTLSDSLKKKINFKQLRFSTSLSDLYRQLFINVPEVHFYLNFNNYSYHNFSNCLNIIENLLKHEFTQRGSCKMKNLLNPAYDYQINPAIHGKNEMSYTLKFFYTEGHTFTASNVDNHTVGQGCINYYTSKQTDTVHSSAQHRVFVDDVLYVEVHKPNGFFEVIPGLIKSFSAVPNAQEMNKVNNVVANENQHKEAAAKRHDKNVKAIAAKRKAQRARELGVTIADLEKIGTMQKAERTRIKEEKKAKKNTSA